MATRPLDWQLICLLEQSLLGGLVSGCGSFSGGGNIGRGCGCIFGHFLAYCIVGSCVSVFNRLYYAMSVVSARLGGKPKRELFLKFSFEASFTVPPAHLVCGPRGYTVQLTFPKDSAREAIVEILEICQTSPSPPVTTILRGHLADDGLLSFSENGYSLNFEFHPKKHNEVESRQAVDRIIDATARRGGKIHLAKDQVMTPRQFERIYPRHPELLDIKQRVDPEGLFVSDLARRVGLISS